MALATTLQYTESNLIGTLQETIGTDTSSCDIRFIDRVTGAAREPLATTKIFVFDKGSATAPNPNYEIVLASHTTTSNVTTLTSMVRGLEFSGISLASVTARKKQHLSGAEVGVVDLHYYSANIVATLKGVGDVWSCLKVATHTARDADITPAEGQIIYVNDYECYEVYRNGVWWLIDPVFTNSTQRDAAIPSPVNGMKCYNTAEGAFQGYVGGSWTNEGTSTTPNGSTTVAGKFEEATIAEVGAGTQTGGTGADLVINPTAVVKTSSGAADENHLVALNASGQFNTGFIPELARVCQGRLTTTTGVVFVPNFSGTLSTLYFTPYLGNRISLYNGTDWVLYTFTERSLSLSGNSANTSYYVYIYDNAGTLTLELSATGIALQDGILVKSGDATKRYLGHIRIDATGNSAVFDPQPASKSLCQWSLVNYNNPLPLIVQYKNDDSSYTTATSFTTRNIASSANAVINVQLLPSAIQSTPVLVQQRALVSVSNTSAANCSYFLGAPTATQAVAQIGSATTNSASGVYTEDLLILNGYNSIALQEAASSSGTPVLSASFYKASTTIYV